MMGDRDLQRNKTVTSMFSEKELHPPREPTLATIEEGEENTHTLENGGEKIDSVVEERGKKTISHIMNGLHSPVKTVLSNGNGNITSMGKETPV